MKLLLITIVVSLSICAQCFAAGIGVQNAATLEDVNFHAIPDEDTDSVRRPRTFGFGRFGRRFGGGGYGGFGGYPGGGYGGYPGGGFGGYPGGGYGGYPGGGYGGYPGGGYGGYPGGGFGGGYSSASASASASSSSFGRGGFYG